VKRKKKRVYQNKMWDAARSYQREAEKCYKARAYFSSIVARGAQLEALFRVFDFVGHSRPKDRCYDLFCLINRAFKDHWIPHDALHAWRKHESIPLKTYLHAIRETRNGVHAHLFEKGFSTRQIASDVAYVVETMYSLLQIKNARNLMKHLHEDGQISHAEYKRWLKKQGRVE
jgi:hypothetical protein